MIAGSYANGFAPRDGEPEYPQLWTDSVGAWAPCLGPTGSVLRGWSGRANHGTLTGMTLADAWTVSGGRYCLAFDGVDDYVVLNQTLNAGLVRSTPLSISAWIKTSNAAQQYIVTNSSWSSPYVGIEFINQSNGLLRFDMNQDASKLIRKATTATVNNGAWRHVAVTYNGSGSAAGVTLYIDGTAADATTLFDNTDADATSVTNLQIGSRDGNHLAFFGAIDDVRIYNRVLSADKVSLIYSGGFGRGIAYAMRDRRHVRSAGRIPSGATMTGGMYANQCGGMVA